MSKLFKTAFTLIELLVVIAIIGILSGLIIIGMNGMTQKATIAKAQVFSNSLKNALMMNIVSEWRFDNITGTVGSNLADNTIIHDSWSSSNGTTSGGPTLRDYQDCVSGQCLSFDGSNDSVNLSNPATLYPSPNMTLSFWVKPVALTKSEEIFGKFNGSGGSVSSWTYGIWIYSTGVVAFGVGNGTTNNFTSNFSTLSINNWHHIAIDYNASGGVAKYYTNGQYASGKDLTITITPRVTANSYTIGGDVGGNGFTGLIDDVRFFNASMPISQIEEQYYVGLNNLLFNGNISKEEYLNRIATNE
jgi:prepilin-type N-terminal cleavage/methylation domain-containing protein